jgi:hypothetical protein
MLDAWRTLDNPERIPVSRNLTLTLRITLYSLPVALNVRHWQKHILLCAKVLEALSMRSFRIFKALTLRFFD